MGIGNGSAMWAALQQSAALLTQGKADKNAEGRALSNDIKRNQLKLQQQRLAKGAGGKGGGAAKTGSAASFDNSYGTMGLSTGNAARDAAVQHVFADNSDAADSAAADSGIYPDD
jgi:hypothetical protein